ncbi:MAG: nitroreductase family deazaflavin-dependent oxidoreductase [Acidimicrobiia bacterium]|jgi:F420H(2)-dependent quinone reductase
MPLDGEYEPCTWGTAAEQVAEIEASGGTQGTMRAGVPCIVLWTRGSRTGKVRKTPLIRVTDGLCYAAVGSMGGAPKDPSWVGNLRADGRATVQDGPALHDVVARELAGDEKEAWWRRATEVWPAYDEYQARTDRSIPVFVLEPD